MELAQHCLMASFGFGCVYTSGYVTAILVLFISRMYSTSTSSV
jgi:hypothetical protein